jgi:hypothetical protein
VAFRLHFNSIPEFISSEKQPYPLRVRLKILHMSEEHKRGRVSRDDARTVVKCQQSWQEDRVEEEVQEEEALAEAAQPGPA